MRKRLIAGLIGTLVITACGGGPAPAPLVEDARIRLPAAPGLPAAGYFRLTGGESGDALVAAQSPAAERIEMHESATDARGVTSMRRIADAPLGEEVEFAPGGRHLMVFGLRGDVSAGGTIPLTFTFRTAPPVTVQARLLPPGGAAHGH